MGSGDSSLDTPTPPFRPAQRDHHRDIPGCSHQTRHRGDERRPMWTAAGRVGSRQQALQPTAASQWCLGSGPGSRRLGPLPGESSVCLVGLRQAEPRGPLIPAQWRGSPPAFPGPATGHFAHSSLFPQKGAVIYSPLTREANEGAGPHHHCTAPGPGSHTPRPHCCPWSLGGREEAPGSLASGRGQAVSTHTTTAILVATHLPADSHTRADPSPHGQTLPHTALTAGSSR